MREVGSRVRGRRALAVGVLATAIVGIGAQSSFASDTVDIAVANNAYPA